MCAVPLPRGFDYGRQAVEFRFPSENRLRLIRRSYQHRGVACSAFADLGWNLGLGAINLGLSYDFSVAPLGPLNFYVGPSAQVWAGFGEKSYVGLGVGAQIGLEYCFSFPLQLSLDWRPLFTILPGTGFGWQSLGLGIRYLF